MTRTAAVEVQADPVNDRLQELLRKHSQSEIARKTGVSRQNVCRYMGGAKASLKFGAALVDGLGVNPLWLLTGKGMTYLSDVSPETASAASHLLELVQAMSAVERMKLGELAGKDRPKILRQLTDSVRAHGLIRERLQKKIHPALTKYVGELQQAIGDGKLERARELLDVVDRLAGFCVDERISRMRDSAEAHLMHRTGNFDRAIELQRRVFHRCLHLGVGDVNFDQAAHNLVVALAQVGRYREALRTCNSVMALMEDERESNLARLRTIRGDAYVQTGDMKRGVAELALGAMFAPPGHRISEGLYYRAQLLAGRVDLHESLSRSPHNPSVSASQIFFAQWLEDPELLERAYRFGTTESDNPLSAAMTVVTHAERLLQIMNAPTSGRRTVLKAQLAESEPGGPGPATFGRCLELVHRTQLARVGGNRQLALKLVREADRNLSQLPEGVRIPVIHRAIHWKNVLLLLGKQAHSPSSRRSASRLVRTAQAFFDEYLVRGFRCFAPWVSEEVRRAEGLPG